MGRSRTQRCELWRSLSHSFTWFQRFRSWTTFRVKHQLEPRSSLRIMNICQQGGDRPVLVEATNLIIYESICANHNSTSLERLFNEILRGFSTNRWSIIDKFPLMDPLDRGLLYFFDFLGSFQHSFFIEMRAFWYEFLGYISSISSSFEIKWSSTALLNALIVSIHVSWVSILHASDLNHSPRKAELTASLRFL